MSRPPRCPSRAGMPVVRSGRPQPVGPPAGRRGSASETDRQASATSWLTGSASHAGIRARAPGHLPDVISGEPALDRADVLCNFPRHQPGQGADGVSGRQVRRNQLPGWSMAQDDGLFAEFQVAIAPRRQVHRLHRHLCGQAQSVGRVAAAEDDGFVPQHRECREGLLSRGRA